MEKVREAICPTCGATIYLPMEDVYIGNVIHCPKCGARLEVVREDPLELDELFADEEEEED